MSLGLTGYRRVSISGVGMVSAVGRYGSLNLKSVRGAAKPLCQSAVRASSVRLGALIGDVLTAMSIVSSGSSIRGAWRWLRLQ